MAEPTITHTSQCVISERTAKLMGKRLYYELEQKFEYELGKVGALLSSMDEERLDRLVIERDGEECVLYDEPVIIFTATGIYGD